MLRAERVEIKTPEDEILATCEFALFAQQHKTMGDLAELNALKMSIPDENWPDFAGWVMTEADELTTTLKRVERSLEWVRSIRASCLSLYSNLSKTDEIGTVEGD